MKSSKRLELLLFSILFLLPQDKLHAQGTFWDQTLNLPNQAFEVIAEDPYGNLFAGGNEGQVYMSSDSGNTWIDQKTIGLPAGWPLYGLLSMDSITLLCRIPLHGLYSTTDPDINWISLEDSSVINGFDDVLISPQGYLFGRNNTDEVYRSTDKGFTWEGIYHNTQGYFTSLCFDSTNHVLLGVGSTVLRCGVLDSVWTDLGMQNLGMLVLCVSMAPNGDILAGGTCSSTLSLSLYRDGKWTLRNSSNIVDYPMIISIDSSGVLYLLTESNDLFQSLDYGVTLNSSFNSIDICQPNNLFISRSGYLFAPDNCGVVRSINRLGDTVLHFPNGDTTGCESHTIAESLGKIRALVVRDESLYLSDGTIVSISKYNGGTETVLFQNLADPTGPLVILNDTAYFVAYDANDPLSNSSMIYKASIITGGNSLQGMVAQTKRIVDLKYADSSLYWLCTSTMPDTAAVGNGKIQRMNLTTDSVVTLADSLSATENLAIVGDSIIFGEIKSANGNGGLMSLPKSGGTIHTLLTGSFGTVAADSNAIAYFSFDDSSVHLLSRSNDSMEKLLSTWGSNVSLQMDASDVYCLTGKPCNAFGTLQRISRQSLTVLQLDDSISCNPFFVIDSSVVYVSDDSASGRIRQICNPPDPGEIEAIVPALLDFGVVTVGASKSEALPVTNSSSKDETIYANLQNGLFTIYPPYLSIPANSEMSFKVWYNGTTAGSEDEVLFSANGGQAFASTTLRSEGVSSVATSSIVNSSLIAYPNPTSALVDFHYSLTEMSFVSLTIYDPLGRMVARPVVDEVEVAGNHDASFDTKDLPAGLYSCSLIVDGASIFTKIAIMK